MATYPCRNPTKNPKCAGACAKDGGLCRSCGILEARVALGHSPSKPAATAPADFLCAESGCLRRVKREGSRCPVHRARATPRRGPAAAQLPAAAPAVAPRAVPAPAAAAPGGGDGPGPITVALARMIEEAAATSPHVAARLTVDRASRTIHIEVDLAAEAPVAARSPEF